MKTWSKGSLKSLEGIHPDLRRVMDRALQESPIDFSRLLKKSALEVVFGT